MNKFITILFMILLAAGSGVRSQSLDDILKKYYAAKGQDSLLKMTSLKTSGKVIQSGIELPFSQIVKRPSLLRLEFTFQGLTAIQTFNGREGWFLDVFSGSTNPEPISDDNLKSIRYEADIYGMLWKPDEKGHKITLAGKEEMEGTECYIVKLDTKEGDVFKYYIDSDSYIPLRVNSKIKLLGIDLETDQYYSNYILFRGVAFPGNTEIRVNGQLSATTVVEKIESDLTLDDSIFEKPKK